MHCLEKIKERNRVACIKHAMDDIRRVEREHQAACYGRDSLQFEWKKIEHTGVWAWGGPYKDEPPILLRVSLCVPCNNEEYGWYCYLGPRPNFTNEG